MCSQIHKPQRKTIQDNPIAVDKLRVCCISQNSHLIYHFTNDLAYLKSENWFLEAEQTVWTIMNFFLCLWECVLTFEKTSEHDN